MAPPCLHHIDKFLRRLAFGLVLWLPPGAVSADILIATVGPMSGPQQVFGEQMKRGAEAAVADINANGGVLGERVVMVVKDDECEAKRASEVAQEIVAENVVFVAGHLCSGASIAASRIYTASEILQISPATTAPQFTENGDFNVFRVTGRDDQQGKAAGEMLATRFADRKIAILYDQSAYGAGLSKATKDALNNGGVREAVYEAYDPADVDFAGIAKRLKEAGIGVVYLGGYHTEAGKFISEAHRIDFKPQLVSGDGLATAEFWKIAGTAGEGTLMTFAPDPRKNEGAGPVVDRFRKDEYEPEGYTLYTYGAIQVWAQAVQKAGTANVKDVIAALRANQFETVLGTIGFDARGDVTAPGYVWYVWKNGVYETVK